MKHTTRLFQAIALAVLIAPLFGFAQMFTLSGINGAVAGAAVGGIAGHQIHGQTGQGALAGAVVGLFVGNTVHNEMLASSDLAPRFVQPSPTARLSESPQRTWQTPANDIILRDDGTGYLSSSSPGFGGTCSPCSQGRFFRTFAEPSRRSAYAFDNPRATGAILGAVLGGVIQRRHGGDALTGIAVGGSAGYVLASLR